MNINKAQKAIALAASVTMVAGLAACGSDSNNTAGQKADVDCAAYEVYGDLSGKKVTMYTSWIDEEGEATDKSFETFRQCTGLDIQHEGSRDLAVQLPVRVKAGSAPDIAVAPQPGLLKTMVATGKVVEPSQEAADNVTKWFSEDWKEYGSVDGTLYAVPMGASTKSFVWYSPKAFKEKGYEVPKTWDEMMDLTKKIAEDNAGTDVKPWSVGIEGGSDTGWPATDWLEDAVIRFTDAETYNKWVDHEIPFNDAKILAAFKEIGKILKNNDYVNGGFGDSQSIASTAWQDAGTPLVEGTGYLMHQALFYQTNYQALDDSLEVGEDGDVWAFQMPGLTEDSTPMIGGGDFAMAFSDRPEVLALQAYIASPEWANERAKAVKSGWVNANKGLDESLLGSKVDKLSWEILTDPTTEFRFDASDLMPSEVGAGTFWKEMTEYFAQDKSEEEVLDAIEASWPTDK